MLIDLNVEGKKILIIGGGLIGEFKTEKAIQSNSSITVVSNNFTEKLKQFKQEGSVELVELNLKSNTESINSLIKSSDIIIIATENEDLNSDIARKAKTYNKLVSVVDNPAISDFNSPATIRFEDIRIGICTGGKSPAMSKILRKRIEKLITKEDILHVKLQEYVRKFLKENYSEKSKHKNSIYSIIENPEIKKLLHEGKLEESKILAKQIIKNHVVN